MQGCDPTFSALVSTTKRCGAWLHEAGIPFVLGGSVAAWARGGPAVCSDVDLVVRPDDAERALEVLVEHGLRPERPPEGWLLKAYDGEGLVDLIFELHGLDIEETFARAEVLSVMSVDMAVMAVDDVLVSKLLAFEEHYIDFVSLLPIARALREQVDWTAVRRRTAQSAIAIGFLAMAEALRIVPAPAAGGEAARESRIRVTTT
jgi:hypothetical protein